MENGWQFAKVYRQHIDAKGNPTAAYWEWAQAGWQAFRAERYPMGKGKKPLYSVWRKEKLDYIQARKRIYCPLYAHAVMETVAFAQLRDQYLSSHELTLWDFDGYDHRALGMTYDDVLNDRSRKMGHAFVLAMLLEGIHPWEK